MDEPIGTRILLAGLLAFLLVLPARAQQTPSTEPAARDRLWSRYQNAPSTEAGQKAGRSALYQWATAPNPTRLQTVAKSLDPASNLWPDLIQALSNVYRTAADSSEFRNGYEAILTSLRRRVTDAEGWLSVMIALGDYYRTVEKDRWAALEMYETAYQHGGSQRLIDELKDRLGAVCPRDVGSSAPSFQVTTLDGSKVNLEDLHGDPILLYFWARWCSPCLRTLPKLNELRSAYRPSNLHLLGLINEVNDRDQLESYLNEQNITWPQAITDGWSREGRTPERLYGLDGPGPPHPLG